MGDASATTPVQFGPKHDSDPRSLFLVCADAQALPIADASIDLVYSNLCLQWCEDPGLALDEFRRVLRPGGMLLFSFLVLLTLYSRKAATSWK